jgi:2-oxoglutarate dehydrogenase E2 component (dihydrolipoamide succinyltransferase)
LSNFGQKNYILFMAKYQLLLPKMGESVAEATIIKWTKNPGDYVEADEAVMEIATDKVDSEVPSPVAGKLIEQLYKENDVVQVGAVIAVIETEIVEETQPDLQSVTAPEETQPDLQSEIIPEVNKPEPITEPQAEALPVPGIEQLEQRSSEQNHEAFKSTSRFYSPLVKHIAAQEKISIDELDRIPGTGAEGRLTKDDLLNYLQDKQSKYAAEQKIIAAQQPAASSVVPPVIIQPQSVPPNKEQPKPAQTESSKTEPDYIKSKPAPAISVSGDDEIIEMDRMRRLIADHMVMSKHVSPHVTSFVEADVTGLVMWREKIKSSFEKREGEKITFTPIFIEAVVKAIKDMPMINVSVNGTQIIKKAAINISMATALPNGNLIVPVIKKADELNLLGLTKAVNDLAVRARTGKLQPDDVKDGTFTITNIGSFGNIMGVPIINQPQVAILAVGVIKKKPAVIETKEGDVIAIRHMMFLSMSYDHRVVDGALGGSFIRRVADYLENWDTDRDI